MVSWLEKARSTETNALHSSRIRVSRRVSGFAQHLASFAFGQIPNHACASRNGRCAFLRLHHHRDKLAEVRCLTTAADRPSAANFRLHPVLAAPIGRRTLANLQGRPSCDTVHVARQPRGALLKRRTYLERGHLDRHHIRSHRDWQHCREVGKLRRRRHAAARHCVTARRRIGSGRAEVTALPADRPEDRRCGFQ